MTPDPAAVTGLGAFLRQRCAGAVLISAEAAMATVPRAASVLGVEEAQIVKSIVFQHKKDEARVCLAIVSGGARVQIPRVARAIGMTQLKLASARATLAATGYPVGGVPPVGHLTALPVVVDRAVLCHDVVFGGGGDEWHMVRISPADIVRLTGATVACITAAAEEPQGGRG